MPAAAEGSANPPLWSPAWQRQLAITLLGPGVAYLTMVFLKYLPIHQKFEHLSWYGFVLIAAVIWTWLVLYFLGRDTLGDLNMREGTFNKDVMHGLAIAGIVFGIMVIVFFIFPAAKSHHATNPHYLHPTYAFGFLKVLNAWLTAISWGYTRAALMNRCFRLYDNKIYNYIIILILIFISLIPIVHSIQIFDILYILTPVVSFVGYAYLRRAWPIIIWEVIYMLLIILLKAIHI